AASVARALPMLATSLGFLAVPVLGMIVSAVIFGETISLALAGGAALVLAGVGLVALGTARG
ncbi:MAG TPA: EamA family transporter, partial [Alphaproteobacteria bacterium]